MTLLVFGRTGQLARALQDRLGDGAVFLGREEADLADPALCADAIQQRQPSAVINAAAWTDVDGAEASEAEAFVVNADAPAAMAQTCAALGVPFVHISTDYVFDGSGTGPWSPQDRTSPQNAYGRTKLAGETAVQAARGPHAVLRTSWVVSPFGKNFVKTMLRLGAERERLTIVADQIGAPTPAADLAAACLAAIAGLKDTPTLSGLYHVQGAPYASWADVAREVFEQAGLSCKVEDIPTSAYPTPAVRPLNSRLECSATTAAFGWGPPDWRDGLGDILAV